MARRFLSVVVGVLIAAAVFAFLQAVSSDLRWVFALGLGLTLAAGVWNGRRRGGDLLDALSLSVPLAAAFAVFVVPELPALWPHCVLWVTAAVAGHVWQRASARRFAVTGGLLAVVLVGVGYGAFYLPRAIAHALTKDRNEPAPEFTLQTLAGAEIPRLDWQGKVVVLDFFATYCGPCIAELPKLAEVNARLAGRSDVIVLVVGSESGGETLDSLRSFAERSGRGLAFAWDPRHKARDACGVRGTPSLAVLDLSGRLRRVHEGYNAAETGFSAELLRFIDRLSSAR
ncbi:MAG: TlpA disulfide reductase family protein [Thermoanaerobaculaceae bacterium]|jgi:thiol-disulfide isomerase/thioredoxin